LCLNPRKFTIVNVFGKGEWFLHKEKPKAPTLGKRIKGVHMSEDAISSAHNFQAVCNVENLIGKIQRAIECYRFGLYPVEIFACKMEEFSQKISNEINDESTQQEVESYDY
jgi:hypothetical protein